MKWCKKCILPDTRPNLKLDENGICNACMSGSSEYKDNIDWEKRLDNFKSLISSFDNVSEWDCVIPVSGGKDSTWQVVKTLEYGLKPLCVTWKTPARNTLGQKNLDNLIALGVDHIDFSINPKVERIFTKNAFLVKGIPLIPMHLAIYNIPIRIASSLKIPLVIYGENSAVEYGGNKKYHSYKINSEWIQKFGVNDGTTAEDWISPELSKKDLLPYSSNFSTDFRPQAIFLSYFFKWDVFKTRDLAEKYGLTIPKQPKTGKHAFSDIDDEFLVTIHHWIKWYKFGFTRRWDNLSLEIRSGKISREDAIQDLIINKEKLPIKEINLFAKYINLSSDKVLNHFDKLRNKNIWSNKNNRWCINNPISPDLSKDVLES